MRRHVFIGRILVASIAICYACTAPTVSAQTHELKEVKVDGTTMYVSTDLTSIYNQKPYTAMCFYYNNDTSVMWHSMYRYKYWEGAEQELFRLDNSFFEAFKDDIIRKENDSIYYYWRFILYPIVKMFDTDEQECLVEKLKQPILINLYLNHNGKIANVGLQIPTESYGLCLRDDKIYAILKYVMEANLVFPQYTNFLRTHHEALEKYRGQWNFIFTIPLRSLYIKKICESLPDTTNTTK